MVAIGVVGAIKLRRITKIDARVTNYFDIEVETYDEVLFTADDFVPDNPDQNYIWSQPANPLTRPVSYAEMITAIHLLMAPQPNVDIPSTSNLDWTGDEEEETVSWSATDSDEPVIFRFRGVSYEITPDSTTEEFIYWDPAFTTIFRTTNLASVAFVVGKWVMCRNKAGFAIPATPMQLMHAGAIQAGTLSVGTADIQDLAVDKLQIAGLAVDTEKLSWGATKILTTASAAWLRSHEPHSTYSQVMSCTITSQGNAIKVEARAQHAYADDGDVEDAWIRLREGGTVLMELHTPNWGDVFTFAGLRAPGAGARTYYIDIRADSGSTRVYYRDMLIYLVEDKGK